MSAPPRRALPARLVAALPALPALLALLAAGCATPSPPPAAPAITPPPAWSAGNADAAPAPGDDWWERFDSAELRSLLADALRHNRDLHAARARLAQARASASIAGAAAAPQLDAALGAGRERAGGSAAAGFASIDFHASYEVDFAGRNQRTIDAAGERARAGAFAIEAVRISLQAEIANRYFEVLSLRDRLALAQRSLANAESTLALLQTQARAGALSNLEVLRQRALVASVQANVPPLQRALQQALDALAVLTGRAPQGFAVTGTQLTSLRLPSVAAGVPAALLQRRPDVRQAEAELAAANADVAAARAALFPSLRLGVDAGSRAVTVASLLRSGSAAYAIGLELAAVLFDGGRRGGEIALSVARRDELVAAYEQAVLASWRDVEDALAAVQRSAEQAAHQEQVTQHAREALRLADLRYRAGAVDFSTVLDAQRVLLAAEDAQEAIVLARYGAAVALFRALGGGWEPEARSSAVAAAAS